MAGKVRQLGERIEMMLMWSGEPSGRAWAAMTVPTGSISRINVSQARAKHFPSGRFVNPHSHPRRHYYHPLSTEGPGLGTQMLPS